MSKMSDIIDTTATDTAIVPKVRLVDLMAEGQRLTAELAMGADTDEELDAKQAAFDNWIERTGDKALAYKIVMGSLDAQAQQFRDAAKQIVDRAKMLEAQSDKMRDRLKLTMQETGVTRLNLADGGVAVLSERKTQTVTVTNQYDLPENCGKTVFQPDLAEIKRLWKLHGKVDGAEVVETVSTVLTVK